MKLQDINQGQVQQLQSMDPSSIIGKYQAKQSIAQNIYKLGDAVASVKLEHDTLTANADYRSAVSDYEKLVADKAFATPEELKEWGIAGDVDMQDANGQTMTAIPKWKWYSQGLERVMETSMEAAGARITSPQARSKWEQQAKQASDQELERAYQRTGQMAIQSTMKEAEAEYKIALERGNYDKARDMLESPIFAMNPSLRKTMGLEIDKAEEMSHINRMLATSDVGQLNELIAEITSPEYDSSLNDQEYLRMFASVTARRDSLQRAQDDAASKYQDALAIDALVKISSGQADINYINSIATKLGKENHARLINAARTQSQSGIVSSPLLINSYSRRILELESGISPEGELYDFEAEVQKLQKQLIDDTLSFDQEGNPVMRLSATEARTLGDRLQKLKPFPFMTEEYKYTVNDLRNVILGADPMMQFMASETSRQTLSRATTSLRTYIETNGGTQADISKWRNEQMPRFLDETAKADALKLPQEASVFVKYNTTGPFRVDKTSTKENYLRAIDEADGDPDAIARLTEAALAYDQWLKRFGGTHAE